MDKDQNTIYIKKTSEMNPDYLPEYFCWWDNVTKQQVVDWTNRLETAKSESDLQDYIEKNPNLLVQHLGGGHGRWVIPQKSLGSEYSTDFIIGDRNSIGFEWHAIELERSDARMFTKKGDPTAQLTHAIRQITDWRAWIKRNQDYAARTRENQGLGLIDIDSSVPGIILLGREKDIDPETNDRRRQLVQDLNIKIHSYDWIARGLVD